MGYRIEYEGAERYLCSAKREGDRWRRACLVLVMIALAVSLAFPQIKKKVVSFLIPGNDIVTLQAVEELAHCLQSGDSTKDALTAFCRTVIENGQ